MKFTKLTLEQKIIISSYIPDILTAVLIYLYLILITQMTSENIRISAIAAAILISFSQFVVAPFIDHFAYRNASRKLDNFKKGTTTEEERTELLIALSKVPTRCAAISFGFFAACSVLFFLVTLFMTDIGIYLSLLVLCEALFGSALAALMGFGYSRPLCTKEIYAVVKAGVSKKTVLQKKNFGGGINKQIFFFLILPALITTTLSMYVLIINALEPNMSWEIKDLQSKRLAYSIVLNVCIQLITAFIFYRPFSSDTLKMQEGLNEIYSADFSDSKILDTDIRDEIAFNLYLANTLLINFRRILRNSTGIGKEIDETSKKLVEISNETESTALEQATSTSEMVSTMESANKLSHEIEEKITQISEIAKETAENVSSGSDILQMNLSKMQDIIRSNEQTVQGIHDLNSKINSIWEVVSLINSIADQTKIIAFNAELESSLANENNRSFKNVANEIRRLANGTMDSTKDIKRRISEIQEATNDLLSKCVSCSKQVNTGTKLIHSLETSFENISQSAQENVNSSNEIHKRISQETEAFEQIVKTLQQISRSVENFSQSTSSLIDTAKLLQKNSNDLSELSARA